MASFFNNNLCGGTQDEQKYKRQKVRNIFVMICGT